MKKEIERPTKPCPVCGLAMYKHVNRKTPYKSFNTLWICEDRFCGHQEREEGNREKRIRWGWLDKTLNILHLPNS